MAASAAFALGFVAPIEKFAGDFQFTEGQFFAMTAAGELVWEYINPLTRNGSVKMLGDVLPMANSAFCAYCYAPDHPAFKSRDLTRKGTITELAVQGIDAYPKRRPPGGKDDRPARRGKGAGRGRGPGNAGRQDQWGQQAHRRSTRRQNSVIG